MTGFKLHCPPGFVDRAYLVFLVADITHRTTGCDGSESLSPPLRVRVMGSGFSAGDEPQGAIRARQQSNSMRGVLLGRPVARRWKCVIVAPTARSSSPAP